MTQTALGVAGSRPMQFLLIKSKPFLSIRVVNSFMVLGLQLRMLKTCLKGPGRRLQWKVSTEPEAEDLGQGHITTDLSDSSGSKCQAYAPVIDQYLIDVPEDKKLWLNKNSRMFHLSGAEHVKVLLCGRRITSGFREHQGEVRYDSAKCKLCFRLKDS